MNCLVASDSVDAAVCMASNSMNWLRQSIIQPDVEFHIQIAVTRGRDHIRSVDHMGSRFVTARKYSKQTFSIGNVLPYTWAWPVLPYPSRSRQRIKKNYASY
jgi:hypothetical protein